MKKEMGKYGYFYPVPTVLLGSSIKGKANYNTLGNAGIISMFPPVVYVSSEKKHYTNQGIRETGYFSINIPSVALLEKTDYCGLVSGINTDKSAVFENFYGKTNTPMICECPINLECKVIETVSVYDMEVFIGYVIETYIYESCITDGKPDIEKIDPIIYTIKGNYRRVGKEVGKPFTIGKTYERK